MVSLSLFLIGDSWNGQCVKDSEEKRIFETEENVGAENNIEDCKESCHKKGFPYMGLQATTWCHCGMNPPPPSSKVPDDDCSHLCPGNHHQKCGGAWRMNIHTTYQGLYNIFEN